MESRGSQIRTVDFRDDTVECAKYHPLLAPFQAPLACAYIVARVFHALPLLAQPPKKDDTPGLPLPLPTFFRTHMLHTYALLQRVYCR